MPTKMKSHPMKPKGRRKSLTGYTNVGWYKSFTKSHPNWKDRVYHSGIMNNPTICFADVKVKITIEEIS